MGDSFFPAVGFVQIPVVLGDPEENIRQVRRLLERKALMSGTLVVLPELWATGFDYQRTRTLAERTPEIIDRMQEIAGKHALFLAGSLAELPEQGGPPLNTLMCIDGEGVVGKWPKQYLFRRWHEEAHYQPGPASPPLKLPLGTLGGFVCYDLRFPEIARAMAYHGAQVIMVSAQWPKSRLDHWQALVRARAIENQVYVVAANGCGASGPLVLAGHSMIVSPHGEILAQAGEDAVCCLHVVDLFALEAERSPFCPPGERGWRRSDRDKITTSLAALQPQLAAIRRQGASIAFTNGCFDLLHAGHVSYLERARRCADCLVVGLNSDESIQRLKGSNRPVQTELERARVLASLGCVDFVILFSEDTPLKLIKALMPDVLVKGADWPEDKIVGAREVQQAGGRVERIAFTYQQSTSSIIAKIVGQGLS